MVKKSNNKDLDVDKMKHVHSKSYYYEQFLKELRPQPTFYERLAILANKLFNFKFEWKDYDEEMERFEYYVRFKDALALGIIAFLLTLPFASYLYSLGGAKTTKIAAILLPFLIWFAVTFYPLYKAQIDRMRILGQAPLAMLYVAIAMEVTPNLESSVEFASRSMPGIMGRVFKKLLWGVQTRQYIDMEDALLKYAAEINDWAPHISESLYLIATSTREIGNRRRATLEKALNTALSGTKKVMEEFARSLSLPVMATNAFGVMLPVLLLVLSPVIATFSNSETDIGLTLFLLYNFYLPLVLLGVILWILARRPASLKDIKYKPPKTIFSIFGLKIKLKYICIAIGLFFALIQKILINKFPYAFSSTAKSTTVVKAYVTLPIILAFGLPLGIYLFFWAKDNMDIKIRIDKLEREFASVLYHLSSVLEERVPIEQAFEVVSARFRGTETERFFQKTIRNIKLLGMPIEDAIFDEKIGSISEFPSELIKNIMHVIMMSAKKGSYSAALTAKSISNYLKTMQDVKDKMEDLLSEALTSLTFQGKILIPIITGVIVGMGEIVTMLLANIANQMSEIGNAGLGMGYGYISQVMNIRTLVQPSFMQFTVGLYVIIVAILVGFLIGGLEEGFDKITIVKRIGDLLLIGVILYSITVFLVSLIFGGMAYQLI